MSELVFKIDEGALKDQISAAILAQLGQDTQAQILRDALKYLLEPRSSGYGPYKSPVQSAFDNALGQLVREMAHEYVRDNTTFRDALTAELEKVAAQVLASSEKLRESLIEGIVRALEYGGSN